MQKITFKGSVHKHFYQELSAKVKTYLTENKLSGKGTWKIYFKTSLILLVTIICYVFLLTFTSNIWLTIALYALLGICMTLIGFNIMHDGSHGSYSPHRWLNELMAYSIDLLGASAPIWKIKHNHLHHTYTNIDNYDDDIDANPFLRLSPHQPRYWYHKFQYIYAPLLYAAAGFFWYVNAFVVYFRQKICSFTLKISFSDHLIFWSTRVFFLVVFIVLPSIFLGRKVALLGLVVVYVIMGLVMSLVFQLAHVVEKTQFPTPNEQLTVEDERSIHELQTTADFATGSKFLTWVLGGLNYQIEHHLFPAISHIHYPAISKLVRQTCDEFGIQYNHYKTLLGAIVSHFRLLRKLGR